MNCIHCGIYGNAAAERSLGSVCLNSAELRHKFEAAGFESFMAQFPNPLRLNLGANDRSFRGFVSVDITPPADFLCDLSQPWPWPDSSVSEVLAYDVFEHIRDKRQTMNELWRVLIPGGKATLQVPHATLGDGGHCDPTHVSYWTTSDFEYYTKGIPERERFRNSSYYGVKADFRVTNLTAPGSKKCVPCADRRFGAGIESTRPGCVGGHIQTAKFARTYGGYVVEMQIQLEAIK